MQNYLSLSARRPETRLLAIISGLWMSRLVGVASKLALFELLSGGPMAAKEIAKAKGLADDPLARALEGLVHLGLLERHADGFALSDDGRLMLPGAQGGFKEMATLWRDLFDGAWSEIETTLRTGEPGFNVHHGEPIFSRLGRDAAIARQFDGAMRGLSQLIARDASLVIAQRIHGLRLASLCDLGGGDGHLIAEIARRCPDVACKLFDLPHVVEPNVTRLRELAVVALDGSFFESVPEASAHILSNVIHDWSDDDAIRILNNVRRAQSRAGTLFLLEMMLGGETEPPLARSTDLNMMILTGGRERTRDEFQSLLARAGYHMGEVEQVAGLTCLIEARPIDDV